MWSRLSMGSLLLVIVISLLASLSTQSDPAPSRHQQFEDLHRYLRQHYKKSWERPLDPPAWLRGRFHIGLMGVPVFRGEDHSRWEACVTFYRISPSKLYRQDPYADALARERMEICVLYALGLIPDEAVEAYVPADEVARRYDLVPDDYMFPEKEFDVWSDSDDAKPSDQDSRSEFRLGNVVEQAVPYMRLKGSQAGGSRPALRAPR